MASSEKSESSRGFNDKLKIDEVDKEIIQLLQENPEMTHSDISDKVHKSQPAVGARIIKLRRKNLLNTQIGVNFKKVDIKLAKVEMLVKNVGDLLSKIEKCSFILHAFKISGNTNIMILIAAPDIQTIDKMVDQCFRAHPDILTVNISYIISSVKDLILPVNFEIESFGELGCGRDGCLMHMDEENKLKDLIRQTRKKAIEKDIENNEKKEI